MRSTFYLSVPCFDGDVSMLRCFCAAAAVCQRAKLKKRQLPKNKTKQEKMNLNRKSCCQLSFHLPCLFATLLHLRWIAYVLLKSPPAHMKTFAHVRWFSSRKKS